MSSRPSGVRVACGPRWLCPWCLLPGCTVGALGQEDQGKEGTRNKAQSCAAAVTPRCRWLSTGCTLHLHPHPSAPGPSRWRTAFPALSSSHGHGGQWEAQLAREGFARTPVPLPAPANADGGGPKAPRPAGICFGGSDRRQGAEGACAHGLDGGRLPASRWCSWPTFPRLRAPCRASAKLGPSGNV